MPIYDVFKMMDYKPGCVDFCGNVLANSQTEAEDMARLMYWNGPGETLSIEPAEREQEF